MKRSLIKSSASFFAFFCIVFIPFPFNLFKFQIEITDFFLGKLIEFISSSIFGKELHNTKAYSDSFSMYVLVLLLFILSFIVSFILLRSKRWQLNKENIFHFFYALFVYYAALQLLKYGTDKIFKNQFYTPEPNTLFTPMGQLGKDLLYWSSMGTSHFYSVFLGSVETLAAIFILIKRTRPVGLLLSFGILLNVIAVNFGFDISVKLYSLFLLYLVIYLLIPYCKRVYGLLLQTKSFTINNYEPGSLWKNIFLKHFLKWFVVALILVEVFYPFVKSRNFNGDRTGKPYLHGAYEVTQMISGNDTLTGNTLPLKKFFIHKDSYMIFQYSNDGMKDYKLSYDKAKSIFVLTDYDLKQTILHFSYQPSDSILSLEYLKEGKETVTTGKAIDWRKLPALQKGFHWTVD